MKNTDFAQKLRAVANDIERMPEYAALRRSPEPLDAITLGTIGIGLSELRRAATELSGDQGGIGHQSQDRYGSIGYGRPVEQGLRKR